MKCKRRALIVFMRYPEEGKVKRRLAASVGSKEAVRIYEKLVGRTLGLVSDFVRTGSGKVDAFIAYTPPEKGDRMREAYPGGWAFFPQEGAHLGDRMEKAILHVMGLGYHSVVLTGTDLADTEVDDFAEAFKALEDRGKECAVLGPAADGGFYLIGLNRPCPPPFRPEEWGLGEVYFRTERLLIDAGLRVYRLKARQDIDRTEDLTFLMHRPFFQTRLSVIVPTVSGPKQLRPFLSYLESCLWPGDEVVVVRGEGGAGIGEAVPNDLPASANSMASEPGLRIRWISAPRGRGVQLNHGARVAGGDTFLFLHDDGMPPAHFASSVRKIWEVPCVSLGCFRLGFRPSTPFMEIIAAGANLRTRYFKLPFGDQGLFCRREVFEKIGGFKRPYLMEDVEFVRECRRWGSLMILPETLFTSPQRYITRGVIRAFLQNQLVMLLYRLGASDRSLYSLYYREKQAKMDCAEESFPP